MIVTMAFRGFTVREAHKRELARLARGYARYFVQLQTVEWDVRARAGELDLVCRLHGRSGYYRAAARRTDLREAAGAVFDRLVAQRRRRKSVTRRRRRLVQPRGGR